MKKNFKLLTLITTSALLIFTLVGSVQAAPKNERFAGQDRFQTSISIARQEYQGQQVSNIVIASAYSFSDALAASTLATKLKAPIILVGSGVHDSQVSLDFIKNHMTPGGTVTIVGGVGIINDKVEKWLLNEGYTVTRLGGSDRFATDALIVNDLNVSIGTPVVIASGNNFPDALGIASVAASKGWPILLSGPNQLPEAVQNFVSKDQPTDIYIVGGQAVLHDLIQTALQSAAPNAQIQRFGGQDRFDTLSQILYKFYPNPTQIYLANGFDFADALSGSTLAAQNNAPILLIDPKSGHLPPAIRDYLITLRTTGVTPQVNVLGGTVGVPDWVVDRVNARLGIGNAVTPPTPPVTIPPVTTPSAITIPTPMPTVTPSAQNDTITESVQSNDSGSLITINLTNPVTYVGATQYQLISAGTPISNITALGIAATVTPAIESDKALQVEFFDANGSPIGPSANVPHTNHESD